MYRDGNAGKELAIVGREHRRIEEDQRAKAHQKERR